MCDRGPATSGRLSVPDQDAVKGSDWPLGQLMEIKLTFSPLISPYDLNLSYLLYLVPIPSQIHYRKNVLCRDPRFLPRAKTRALGKENVCRARLLANTGRRQVTGLPWACISASNSSQRSGPFCREPRSANVFFAESPRFCSRQKSQISAKDVFPVVNYLGL